MAEPVGRNRNWMPVAALVAVLAAAAAPARAEGGASINTGPLGFTLRAWGQTSDFSMEQGVHEAVTLHGKTGAGVDAELRLTRHLGVGAAFSDLEIGVKTVQGDLFDDPPFTETHGTLQMMPLTVGLFLHAFDLPHFDLYLEPTVGWVLYRGYLVSSDTITSSSAVGGVVGVDVPFSPSSGRGWAVTANIRYLHLFVPDGDFRSDPANLFFFAAGVAYRW